MSLSALSEIEAKHLANAVVSDRIRRAFPPVAYQELMLTAECNLRCSYCWVTGKRPEHMSLETLRRSIHFLARASKGLEKVGILFFGGEPLLRFDLIEETVVYARRVLGAAGKQVSFDMTTNGTLLDEAVCRFLSEHKVKYLLSLDGDQEDHDRHRRTRDGRGSFEQVMSRFQIMKQYQPWQGARVTVAPPVASRLAANVSALFERGINQFIIGPAHGAGWNRERIEEFEQSMYRVLDFYVEQKRAGRFIRIVLYEQGSLEQVATGYRAAWGCGAGRSRICVTPNGTLYGCSKLATILGVGNGLLPLGDVMNGFANWDARKLLNDSSARRRRSCRSCGLAERCTGGCPATNYFDTGNPFVAGEEACAFAWVYDRVGQYAERRLKEYGLWKNGENHTEASGACRENLDPARPGDRHNAPVAV